MIPEAEQLLIVCLVVRHHHTALTGRDVLDRMEGKYRHIGIGIDPADVERKVTRNSKALVLVDFAGQPCDMERYWVVAKKHKLVMIEDAAHALGAEYRGKMTGSYSDMTSNFL